MTVRRCLSARDPLEGTKFLAALRRNLSPEDLEASWHELECVAMYAWMPVLRGFIPSWDLTMRIAQEMVSLYRHSFVLQGIEPSTADYVARLYFERFREYNEAAAKKPEGWVPWLGNQAARNCYGVDKHIGAALEMGLIVGYFVDVFEATLRSALCPSVS